MKKSCNSNKKAKALNSRCKGAAKLKVEYMKKIFFYTKAERSNAKAALRREVAGY